MSAARDGVVLTLGEALIALLPVDSVGLHEARMLQPFVGGAEVNFAIGACRLGVPTAWAGRVGGDPFGDLVLRTLGRESVDTRWAHVDPEQVTGVYFREWLADGVRRPYYYRARSAAARLAPDDLPAPGELSVRWLHVTGITPALGASPREAVTLAVERAAAQDVPISFDPNYRAALWPPAQARTALLPIARRARVLLMSRGEAELLFGATTPEDALARAHAEGVPIAVVKLGRDGVLGSVAGGRPLHVPAAPVSGAPDPVGAGDGFDAGLVAALLAGAELSAALAVGAYVGARAVESVGEHDYPHRDDLPPELAAALGPASAPGTIGAPGSAETARAPFDDRSRP